MRAMGILAAGTRPIEVVYKSPSMLTRVQQSNIINHNYNGVDVGDPFDGRIIIVVAYSIGQNAGINIGGSFVRLARNQAAGAGGTGIFLLEDDTSSTINITLSLINAGPQSNNRTSGLGVYSLKGAGTTPVDIVEMRGSDPLAPLQAHIGTTGGGIVISGGPTLRDPEEYHVGTVLDAIGVAGSPWNIWAGTMGSAIKTGWSGLDIEIGPAPLQMVAVSLPPSF